MAEYFQRSASQDAFFKDQVPGEAKHVLVVSLAAGLVIVGGLLWLSGPLLLSIEQAFNICLLVASVLTLIAYAQLRVRSGSLIFVANLLVFWGFFTVQEPQTIYYLAFAPTFAALSLLFLQIFRLRKLWLAVLLCLPLVILPHLV